MQKWEEALVSQRKSEKEKCQRKKFKDKINHCGTTRGR